MSAGRCAPARCPRWRGPFAYGMPAVTTALFGLGTFLRTEATSVGGPGCEVMGGHLSQRRSVRQWDLQRHPVERDLDRPLELLSGLREQPRRIHVVAGREVGEDEPFDLGLLRPARRLPA